MGILGTDGNYFLQSVDEAINPPPKPMSAAEEQDLANRASVKKPDAAMQQMPELNPYAKFVAADAENVERFVGRPVESEREGIERARLIMDVRKMLDAPDEYLPQEHSAALEELNRRYTLTNQSLDNFKKQFGGEGAKPSDLLRIYVDKMDNAAEILSAPTGPRTDEAAQAFNDERWNEAMKFLGETFGDPEYLETRRAMAGMSREEQAAYARDWMIKNGKITQDDLIDEMNADKFTFPVTDSEKRAWVGSLKDDERAEVMGMWNPEMTAYLDAIAEGKPYKETAERIELAKSPEATKYREILKKREKWVREQRLLDKMEKSQTNERNFAAAMEIVPFMNEAQKQLVSAAAQGVDMNAYRGVFKLMDERTRNTMEAVCNAVRPETDAGLVSGLELGGKRFVNSMTEFTTAAFYQAFKDATAQDELAAEQKFNRDFNNTLGWDKLKDPSGWWEKAWVGLGESMPLQGSAIGGALAFRAATKLAPHPVARYGLTALGAGLEAMGLLSMAGDEYENLTLNGVKREDAIPLAFAAGVGNWMIENMNTEMILGTGLSAKELMRIGLVSSAKAGARCFSKKSVEQFGREFLYREFMETLRTDAAAAFKIAVSENFEEFVQGIVSKGTENFATGEKPLLTAFINPETIEAGAKSFKEAMPTCTLFGISGALFPAGSAFGLNQNGARAGAMMRMDEQLDALLDEKVKNLGLNKKGEEFVKNWKAGERKRIENRAAQIVRGTDGMLPGESTRWLNEQADMTPAERAFYADMVSFFNAARIQVGEVAAKAYADSNLQLFRYEAGGAKIAIDPNTGKVTGVTFKDTDGDVTIGINDLTGETTTRQNLDAKVVTDFISAWNKKNPDDAFTADPAAMDEAELARLDKALEKYINGFYSPSTGKITLTSQARAASLAHETGHATIWDALQNALDKHTELSRNSLRRIKNKAEIALGITHSNRKGASAYDEVFAERVEKDAMIEGNVGSKATDYFEGADVGAAVKNVGKWIANIFRSKKARSAYLPVIRKANVEAINPLQLVKEIVSEAVDDEAAKEKYEQNKKTSEAKASAEAKRGGNAADAVALRQKKIDAKIAARRAEAERKAAELKAKEDALKAQAEAELKRKHEELLKAAKDVQERNRIEAEFKKMWDERIAIVRDQRKAAEAVANYEQWKNDEAHKEEVRKAQDALMQKMLGEIAAEEAAQARRAEEEQMAQLKAEEAAQAEEDRKNAKMLKNRKNAVKKIPDLKAPNGADASAAGVAAYQAAWRAKTGKAVTQEEIDQLAEVYGLPPEAVNLVKGNGGWTLTDKQLMSDESLGKLSDGLIKLYGDIASVKIIVPDVVVGSAEEAANAVPNEVYDPVSDTFIEGRIVVDAANAKTLREQAGLTEPSVTPEEMAEAQARVERKVPSGKQKSADTDYPSAADEIREYKFSLGKKAREDAKALILKKRWDIGSSYLSDEENDKLLKQFSEENPKGTFEDFRVWIKGKVAESIVDKIGEFKTQKEQKAALHWFINGAIRLPEDAPKVTEAIKYANESPKRIEGYREVIANFDKTMAAAKENLAAQTNPIKIERAKQRIKNAQERYDEAMEKLPKSEGKSFEPFDYDSPMAMIDALHEFKPKAKPINPDKVPQLSDKCEMGNGVVTYLVQDDREGQQSMREIINTHWGEDANPWCLLHGDGHGHLSDGTNGGYDAWHYWNHYNALPKRVAFKDGKLLSFMATDRESHAGWIEFDGHQVDVNGYGEFDDVEWRDDDLDDLSDVFYRVASRAYSYYGGIDVERAIDETIQEYIDDGDEASANWLKKYRYRFKVGDEAIPEQWWDRLDHEHEGIPLGNMPVPGDAFGRWADFEIRDGEMKQIGGYRKGNLGESGYVEWYANGLKEAQIVKADEEYYDWENNGDLYRAKVNGVQYTFQDGVLQSVYTKVDGEDIYINVDEDLAPFDIEVGDEGNYSVGLDDDGNIAAYGESLDLEKKLQAAYDKLKPHIAEAERIYRENSQKQTKFSIATDEEYADAVNRGDKETAMRMLKEKQIANGYLKQGYHGTPFGTFTIFETPRIVTTNNKRVADTYRNTLGGIDTGGMDKTLDLVVHNEQGGRLELDMKGMVASRIPIDILGKGFSGIKSFYKTHHKGWGDRRDFLKDKVVDTYLIVDFLSDKYGEKLKQVVFHNIVDPIRQNLVGEWDPDFVSDVTFTMDPGGVKLNEITYDDNGNLIPLSKRYNRTNRDIRFSISSVTDAAAQDPLTPDISTRFSITNENDLKRVILDEFRGSVEARDLEWTDEQITGAVEGIFEIIAGVHAAVKGDKNYAESAKAVPTLRVDWRDGAEKPIATWVRGNIEYKYDMSADTLCINNEGLEQMLSDPTMADLMIAFSEDTEYGSDDYLRLYETLRDMGYVVPCKGCFDAAMRMKMLPSVAQNFIAEVNAVIDERNKNPKKFDADIRSKAKPNNASVEGLPLSAGTKSKAIRIGVAGDKLTKHIDWTQLMSAKGQTKALMDWGGIFRAWQKTGAGRPKDKLLPEAYGGVIISRTTTIIGKAGEKTPSFRDLDVNQGTGLRRNSHSEFRPTLIVDEIQFLRDCWLKGLCVFKYMKELDDVRLFGRMGIKYNMSAFPAFVEGCTAAGLDKNGNYVWAEESVGGREFEYKGKDGKIHYDGAKGFAEAQKYINKDVSLSCVIFSVPHLIKAMTDVPTKSDKRGLFGSLIGFHNSGADAKALEIQGLGKERACLPNFNPFEVEAMTDYHLGVTNFEQVQNDRFGEGWKILLGKKAGTDVKPGHKIEFANGTIYRNDKLGVTIYASERTYRKNGGKERFGFSGPIYILDREGGKVAHSFDVSYNDKVRELGGDYAYQDAADFYIKEFAPIGILPRFDFNVPADVFVKMCKDAKVDPHHPKLGWNGGAWSPIHSEAYYSLFCDFGMTDPMTGKWSPHLPVLDGQRNADAFKNALPADYLKIINAGMKNFTRRKDRESKMDRSALLEYSRRSIQAGKVKAEKVRKVLAKHGFSASEIASLDPEFVRAKKVGKKSAPSAKSNRFSLGNDNAERVAALVGAVGILKGDALSDQALDAIRKSTRASISIPDLRREAERLAAENRRVLNYVAHDKAVDRLIARAGMADRMQKAIDRSRQADLAFATGVQKKMDRVNRANERVIRDTKGFTADTILNELGIDPAALLLSLRPAEVAKPVRTAPTEAEQTADTPHALDATMMGIAQQRAQELLGKARDAVARAKAEEAANPVEIDEDGNKKSNRKSADENDPDVILGTMMQNVILAEIRNSGMSIDNPAEMVKLAEVITEDYIRNHAGLYQGIDLNDIWEDPRARALLGGNISRFAQMAAEAYCPTWTRERVAKKAQMLDDKAVRKLETIEEIGVHMFEDLNRDIVRESRKGLIKQIHKKIDTLARQHEENALNIDRKVSSALSGYLKKVKKAIDMSAEDVEKKIAELEDLCTSRYQGVDPDKANHYRDYSEAQDEIYILSYWGNLKSKMPSEIKADFEYLDQLVNEDLARMMADREEYIKHIDESVAAMVGGIAPDPKNKGKKPTDDPWAYSVVGMFEAKYRQYIRFCKDPAAAQAAREAFAAVEQMINDSTSAEVNFVTEFREKMKALVDECYGSANNARKMLTEVYDAPWYWVKVEGDTNPQVEDDVGVTAKRALQMYVSIVQDDYTENVEKWGRNGEYRAKLERLLGLVDEDGNYIADAPHAKFVEGLRALYLEMGDRLDGVLVETTGTHLRTPNRNYMPVKMDRRIKRGKNGEGRAFSPFAPSLTPRIKNGRDFDQTADIIDIFLGRLSDTAHTIGWAKTGPLIMKIAQSDAIINTIENNFGDAEARRWNNYIFDIVAGPKFANLRESKSMTAVMRYSSLLWLSLNLGSWAKQLTSIPCLALSNQVTFRDVAAGLSMWALKPIQMCRAAYDLASSDAFKARYGSAISNELRYAITDDGGFSTFKQKLVKGIMSGVVGFDKLGVLMASGVYFRRRQQLELQGKTSAEAADLAANWMMAIVDKSMQSGRTINLTETQRNGGLAAFIQFKSAPMQQAQFEMVAYEEWAADKTNAKKLKELVKTIVVNHFAVPFGMAVIDAAMAFLTSWGIPDEEKRERLYARILGEIFGGPFGSLFLIGAFVEYTADVLAQFATGSTSKYGTGIGQLVPAEGAIEFMGKNAEQIVKALEDIDNAEYIDTAAQIGLAIGNLTPGVSWITRTGKKIYDSVTEDPREKEKKERNRARRKAKAEWDKARKRK